jgi:hypothetical protein
MRSEYISTFVKENVSLYLEINKPYENYLLFLLAIEKRHKYTFYMFCLFIAKRINYIVGEPLNSLEEDK